MKLHILAAYAAALLILLAACSAAPKGDPVDTDITSATRGNTAVCAGKITEISEDGKRFLLVNDSGLYAIPIEGLRIEGAQSVCEGMTAEVEYSGNIREIYPSELVNPTVVRVTGQEDALCGLYLDVTEELFNTDTALNDGITYIAFDISQLTNLTENEIEAFLYMAVNRFGGLQTFEASFDELKEQGLLSDDGSYLKDGIFIKFSEVSIEKNKISFDVMKWRSGDGAYYFCDCEAKSKNGEWSYKVGSFAIS